MVPVLYWRIGLGMIGRGPSPERLQHVLADVFAPGSIGAGSVSPNESSFGAIRIGKGAHFTLPNPFPMRFP